MASCFFLLRQFEDVLIYLNSIKVKVLNYPPGFKGAMHVYSQGMIRDIIIVVRFVYVYMYAPCLVLFQ